MSLASPKHGKDFLKKETRKKDEEKGKNEGRNKRKIDILIKDS